MTAPDWSRAPRWADFAAMDSSGAWYWYEGRPHCDKNLGMFCAGSRNVQAAINPEWASSLTARPVAIRPPSVRLTDAGRMFGCKLDDFLAQGWTAETLIEQGYAERAP